MISDDDIEHMAYAQCAIARLAVAASAAASVLASPPPRHAPVYCLCAEVVLLLRGNYALSRVPSDNAATNAKRKQN